MKRTWQERHNDGNFDRFDVLEDLVQEKGILVELSSRDKGLHEVQEEEEKGEDQFLWQEDPQNAQIDIDLPRQGQDTKEAQGSQVLESSILLVLDPPNPKGPQIWPGMEKPILLQVYSRNSSKRGLQGNRQGVAEILIKRGSRLWGILWLSVDM